MPGFERSITIDRPPAQVFAVLDDIQNARRWMPSIRRIEVLTPSHAVDVGYKWRETRRMMGIFRLTMPVEIVRHEPNKAWGIDINNGKIHAAATFELASQGQGTLLTLREDVEDLRGSAKRSARLAKMVEKADNDLLVRLKAYVESLHRLPAPPTPSTQTRRDVTKKARASSSKKPKSGSKKAR